MAALDAGADAVYVGLRGWSRGGARSELEWPEIAAAARLADARGAELQVALNTIPRPREEARFRASVPRLLDVGVRTLIVNDLGLLATLARAHPALRLTASIGCGVQTPGDVAAVADLGAAAVVLPATIDPDPPGPARRPRPSPWRSWCTWSRSSCCSAAARCRATFSCAPRRCRTALPQTGASPAA